VAAMTDEQREAFLSKTRLGMLATLAGDGAPVTVPVWFEWDGEVARIFSGATSGKMRRLARDARASLTATNTIGEPEGWVAFDGTIDVREQGAIELAERLAPLYWDMRRPELRAEVEGWRKNAASLRLLELRPTSIRSSTG
jgi:PPOX class probable F420-dependent enzyme